MLVVVVVAFVDTTAADDSINDEGIAAELTLDSTDAKTEEVITVLEAAGLEAITLEEIAPEDIIAGVDELAETDLIFADELLDVELTLRIPAIWFSSPVVKVEGACLKKQIPPLTYGFQVQAAHPSVPSQAAIHCVKSLFSKGCDPKLP